MVSAGRGEETEDTSPFMYRPQLCSKRPPGIRLQLLNQTVVLVCSAPFALQFRQFFFATEFCDSPLSHDLAPAPLPTGTLVDPQVRCAKDAPISSRAAGQSGANPG